MRLSAVEGLAADHAAGTSTPSDAYLRMMGRLFDLLDTEKDGELSSGWIDAFRGIFQEKIDSEDADRLTGEDADMFDAIRAFTRALGKLAGNTSHCNRDKWVGHNTALTRKQEDNIVTMFNALLDDDDEDAAQGFLREVRSRFDGTLSTRSRNQSDDEDGSDDGSLLSGSGSGSDFF